MQESHHESLPPDDEIDLPKLNVFQLPAHPPSMSNCCPSIYHPSPPIDLDGMYYLSAPPYLASMQFQTLSSSWTRTPTQPLTLETRVSSWPAPTPILPTSTTTLGQRSFTGMSSQEKGFGNQDERAMRSSREQTRAGNRRKSRIRQPMTTQEKREICKYKELNPNITQQQIADTFGWDRRLSTIAKVLKHTPQDLPSASSGRFPIKPLAYENLGHAVATGFQNQNNILSPVNPRSIVEDTTLTYRSGPPLQVYEVRPGEETVTVRATEAETEVDKPTTEDAWKALEVTMKYFELNSIPLSVDELETLKKFMGRVKIDMT